MAKEIDLLVMAGWTVHPKNHPPPEHVIVEVTGSDYLGTWVCTAMRVDYKRGSSMKQLKRKWRWCNADGTVFDDQAIDAWREIR